MFKKYINEICKYIYREVYHETEKNRSSSSSGILILGVGWNSDEWITDIQMVD
ncbi:hypothetical protein D3C76_617020 [compost metagenome]